MRVNVYAEEMTEKIEIVRKHTADGEFTGVRFYLELPVTVPLIDKDGTVLGNTVHRGPFMHRQGDDDSSAVTFWGKRDLMNMLKKSLALLDEHYRQRDKVPAKHGALTDDGYDY